MIILLSPAVLMWVVNLPALFAVQGSDSGGSVSEGVAVNVAMFRPERGSLDFNCEGCKSIVWQSGQVPTARRILKLRLITVSRSAFVVVAGFSICGILACLVFLSLNLYYRRKRAVKLSSPRLNNVAVMGCVIVYSAVILLGLDSGTLYTKDHFTRICMVRTSQVRRPCYSLNRFQVRVYLLSAGFSLAFGSMFAKTYRISKIFTCSSAAVVKDKLLRDKQLIMLIFALLLIDAVILSLWVVIDPMKRNLYNLSLEVSSRSRGVVHQPQVFQKLINSLSSHFFFCLRLNDVSVIQKPAPECNA